MMQCGQTRWLSHPLLSTLRGLKGFSALQALLCRTKASSENERSQCLQTVSDALSKTENIRVLKASISAVVRGREACSAEAASFEGSF